MRKLLLSSGTALIIVLLQFAPTSALKNNTNTYTAINTIASTTSTLGNGTPSTQNSVKPCPGGDFLGLPRWDAYLPGQIDPTTGQCAPSFGSIGDIWLIVAAVIEMLLRIAGLGAVVMVIFGGIKYTTSMGSPDAVNAAKNTIVHSLIGLLIAVSAAFLVTFIAGSLGV